MESDRPGVGDSERVTKHRRLPGRRLHSAKAEERNGTGAFRELKTNSMSCLAVSEHVLLVQPSPGGVLAGGER